MLKLKPCPFCGGIAKLNAPGYEYYSPCWCKCTQCGAEGPTKVSELEAEKGWNERAQENEWISVKDRLPEVGKVVLAFGTRSATTGMFQGVSTRKDCWWWKGHPFKHVSYWMPLPEPPKDGDGDA